MGTASVPNDENEYDTIFGAKIRWKCERGGDFLDVANVLNIRNICRTVQLYQK